jgi:hypothetical protein
MTLYDMIGTLEKDESIIQVYNKHINILLTDEFKQSSN